jgi:folate-binding protein YgfZ
MVPFASGGTLASGLVRMGGKDALGVLHNISTQKLFDLAVGEARLTLFCDFRGRLQHRALVARGDAETVWLVREDAPGDSLAAHLDRSVFRDAVFIEDASERFVVTPTFALGTVAAGIATFAGGVPESIAAPGCPTYAIAPRGSASLPELSAWTRERIAHGWAAQGHEVNEAFHPFEVNLGHGVHLDKGCYTGQESLMRLVTYRSVRRQLARLSGSGPAEPANELTDEADGRAGVITSVRHEGDAWTALAVVRNDNVRAGTHLRVGDTGQARVEQVFDLTAPGGRPLRTASGN